MHRAFGNSPVKIEWRMELDYQSPTDEDLELFVEKLKMVARSNITVALAVFKSDKLWFI